MDAISAGKRLVFIFTALLSWFSGLSAVGDERVRLPSGPERARFLLREAFHAREAVRTGRVQITGTFRREVFTSDDVFEGPVSGRYCFDREANVYRYDGVWACRSVGYGPGEIPAVRPDKSTPTFGVRYGFCRAKDYFAEWSQNAPDIVSDICLRPLTDEPANRSFGCGVRPLHVMAFGLFEHSRVWKGCDLPETYNAMLEMPNIALISDDGRRATVEVGRNDWFFRIDVDRSLAAPVHSEEGVEGEPIIFTSDVEWRDINGVAVPVRYSTWYTVPEEAEQTLVLNMEWLAVNQEISDEEFEYTAFANVPQGMLDVVDMRGVTPLRLGRWIGDGGVLRPLSPLEAPTPRRKPDPPLASAASQSRLWVLYVINGLFLALLIAACWSKRKMRTTTQD